VGAGRRQRHWGLLRSACLAAALAAGLSGCASGLPSIKNPFAKAEVKLPGERIAVITDPGVNGVDQGAAAKQATLPPPDNNASWTQPGGVPSNNLGHLALGETLSQVWSADAGTGSSSKGRLSALPLVADGKVFTLDAAGTVSAFATAGGARVWTVSVTPANEKGAEGFGGGLALDGGQLYVATGYGTVVALNPGSGAAIWTKRIGDPIRSSPTAAGGRVYFVSTDNVMHCLNGTTGDEVWTARGLPQAATLLSNVSPAVGKTIVIAPYPAGDIAAYQIGSGQAAWNDSLARVSENTAAGILADPARPVIDHGVVFAVSHGGKMIASSEATGERLWTRTLTSTQMPWVAGDTVYVVDITGKLLALARADGKVRWITELPTSSRWSGPVLAGGKLWLVSADGLLVGADARSGTVGPQVALGTEVYVSPIVAGGRMYILTDNARLIALN
jgi:outer membrane protein assembly factor BamB